MSFVLVWLAVGVLGGLGAIARFLLDGLVSAAGGARFPYGTLLVNLSGALVLGLLVGLALSGDAYLLAGTAVIGSYTTFSTWMLESHRLAEDGRRWLLWANIALSLVLGVGAAALGRLLGGRLMLEDALRLTAYIGERDRADGRLLADALMDAFDRHGARASVLLRGIEGFGIKHRLQSEGLLTLSEDLPLIAIALDTEARVEPLLEEVRALSQHGVITLERARLMSAAGDAALAPGSDAVKLTIYIGRQEQVAGVAAHVAVVECLRRHGVAGASVLLGLDGTAHGARQRARFFARNARVPLMIQSVGESASVAAALEELAGMLSDPTMTLERVRVCKRDGVLLAQPLRPPAVDDDGLAYWQKLVVYASEQSRYEGQPLHSALVRRLRREGAAGATALRGQWGYHGEHEPHGEAFWSLRRHVPALTLLLDTPANMRRWFEIVDEMTAETGLVTSEIVPALRAAGPGIAHGGLELAARHGRSPG